MQFNFAILAFVIFSSDRDCSYPEVHDKGVVDYQYGSKNEVDLEIAIINKEVPFLQFRNYTDDAIDFDAWIKINSSTYIRIRNGLAPLCKTTKEGDRCWPIEDASKYSRRKANLMSATIAKHGNSSILNFRSDSDVGHIALTDRSGHRGDIIEANAKYDKQIANGLTSELVSAKTWRFEHFDQDGNSSVHELSYRSDETTWGFARIGKYQKSFSGEYRIESKNLGELIWMHDLVNPSLTHQIVGFDYGDDGKLRSFTKKLKDGSTATYYRK